MIVIRSRLKKPGSSAAASGQVPLAQANANCVGRQKSGKGKGKQEPTQPCEAGLVPAAGASGHKGGEQVKPLKSLSDLPDKCWEFAPNDESGIQFFTEGLVGLSEHSIMIDGGSGVNSTTEELVLSLLEENRKAGISLSDKSHPIKRFEKWKHREALRCVAGGTNVMCPYWARSLLP